MSRCKYICDEFLYLDADHKQCLKTSLLKDVCYIIFTQDLLISDCKGFQASSWVLFAYKETRHVLPLSHIII